MTVLTLSEIIFNFVSSFFILVIGGLVFIICIEIIKLINNLKKISNNLIEELNRFFELIENLPIVSRLFKKRKK